MITQTMQQSASWIFYSTFMGAIKKHGSRTVYIDRDFKSTDETITANKSIWLKMSKPGAREFWQEFSCKEDGWVPTKGGVPDRNLPLISIADAIREVEKSSIPIELIPVIEIEDEPEVMPIGGGVIDEPVHLEESERVKFKRSGLVLPSVLAEQERISCHLNGGLSTMPVSANIDVVPASMVKRQPLKTDFG